MSIFKRTDLTTTTRERGTNPPAKGPRPSHPGRVNTFKQETINPDWGNVTMHL